MQNPDSEALNRQGLGIAYHASDRTAASLSGGWRAEPEMMAQVKRAKKSSSISTQAG